MNNNESSTITDWLEADIEQLQQAMSQGRLSAVELTQFYLDRIVHIDQTGPELNSVQTLNLQALQQAAALDKERAENGPRSALHGIPVLVKDNYETQGMPTRAGSLLFADHEPDRDATMVKRLKAAGAVILGKTTMHEFAYGITTEGSLFGATKNPYNLERNPGGSSGGSGAAAAANLATVTMGSDTCGSIRIPAAQNNLVGLRGTQGLSSRAGIIPLSSTQDIGGPLAKSVKDLALVLDVTVGKDPGDEQTQSYALEDTPNFANQLQQVRDVRVGVLKSVMVQEPADQAVAQTVSSALQAMQSAAAWSVVELSSDAVDEALDRPLNGHFVLIYDFKKDMNAYLAANPSLGFNSIEDMLADGRLHPSVAESFQASALMDATTDTTYAEELVQRETLRSALLALMSEHNLDALAYPTIRQTSALIGEVQMGTNCRLAANSGLPAISVPAGFAAGMPVGLELLGAPWSEQLLLNMAFSVEHFHPQRQYPNAVDVDDE